MTPSVAALGLAAVIGLALGSFAVTAGLRLSRGESALRGRSRCDACGQQLSFSQTVPVVSYLQRAGACRDCRARIDPMHLAGESAGAGIVVTSLLAQDLVRVVVLAALGLCLLTAVTVDAKVRRLPDPITMAVGALGLLLSANRGVDMLLAGVLSAGVSVGTLMGLRILCRRWRGDPGLGLGDVKLIGALALWLGLNTTWMIVVASVSALAMIVVARPRDGRLAFGPAIALAAWVVGMGQETGAWPTTT